MLIALADGDPGPTRSFLPWSLLTNPYCLTAIVCGILAIAVSNYLQQEIKPPRDAKRRIIHTDVRRLSDSAYLFQGGHDAVYTLIDVSTVAIYSLYPLPKSEDSSDNSDEDTPQQYTVDGTVYIAKRLATIATVRVLESGLHFQKGRAVRLAYSDHEVTLTLQTRRSADIFLSVLHLLSEQNRRENLSLFLTTFNVGNSQPPDDLSPWLGKAANADIVAIGAQECSYTPNVSTTGSGSLEQNSFANTQEQPVLSRDDSEESESASLLHTETSFAGSQASSSSTLMTAQSSGHSSSREHWHALLVSHFPEDQYACITKQAAWDRCLTIFVKLELLSAVSQVRSDTVNVGLGGVAGNKGAIGVRFSVFGTDFVMINSHLAAHHKEFNKRNEDFASIAHGLHVLKDEPEVDVLAALVHHVFWMGDLNYRINLERDEVLKHVKAENWEVLQAADQLQQQKSMSRAFGGFLEGETNFPPTYRYERGSRKYSDVKLRIPSWCDRILYRSLPGCKLELHEYMPADEIVSSDHSPVWARFTASVTKTRGGEDLSDMASFVPLISAEIPSLLSSPRSLSVRSLLPISGEPKALRLVFKSLGATDIPEMDHGGRRIAVAKALRIDNHLGWKKHEDLGAGQHADPYCTFHGSAVAELDEGEYRTSTITANQNPVWKPEDIPCIDLAYQNRKMIQELHVVITVKDENPARRDGIIGSAVISLEGAARDGVVKFSSPIMGGGLRRGEIVGEYTIR